MKITRMIEVSATERIWGRLSAYPSGKAIIQNRPAEADIIEIIIPKPSSRTDCNADPDQEQIRYLLDDYERKARRVPKDGTYFMIAV